MEPAHRPGGCLCVRRHQGLRENVWPGEYQRNGIDRRGPLPVLQRPIPRNRPPDSAGRYLLTDHLGLSATAVEGHPGFSRQGKEEHMETTAPGALASTSPEPAPSLEALLVKCAPDRLALNKEIDELIGALQFAAIRAVETALPDFREPGSTDCKLHGALRNDLLNKFNGKRRELLNVTKNY